MREGISPHLPCCHDDKPQHASEDKQKSAIGLGGYGDGSRSTGAVRYSLTFMTVLLLKTVFRFQMLNSLIYYFRRHYLSVSFQIIGNQFERFDWLVQAVDETLGS
jgi:hypothetical protein